MAVAEHAALVDRLSRPRFRRGARFDEPHCFRVVDDVGREREIVAYGLREPHGAATAFALDEHPSLDEPIAQRVVGVFVDRVTEFFLERFAQRPVAERTAVRR